MSREDVCVCVWACSWVSPNTPLLPWPWKVWDCDLGMGEGQEMQLWGMSAHATWEGRAGVREVNWRPAAGRRRIPTVGKRGNVCWQMDLNPASQRVAWILITVHWSHLRLTGGGTGKFYSDNSHLVIYVPVFYVVTDLVVHTASPRIQVLSDTLVTIWKIWAIWILKHWFQLLIRFLCSLPIILLKVVSFLPLQSLFPFPHHWIMNMKS